MLNPCKKERPKECYKIIMILIKSNTPPPNKSFRARWCCCDWRRAWWLCCCYQGWPAWNEGISLFSIPSSSARSFLMATFACRSRVLRRGALLVVLAWMLVAFLPKLSFMHLMFSRKLRNGCLSMALFVRNPMFYCRSIPCSILFTLVVYYSR